MSKAGIQIEKPQIQNEPTGKLGSPASIHLGWTLNFMVVAAYVLSALALYVFYHAK